MIMPRGSNQLLLPVNPFFIAMTLVLALGINLLPLGRHPAQPDMLALVLVFWNVHQPRRVGVGVAFVFGLLMDVHEGALLGQHALAYTLLSFGAISAHRRLLWFSLAEQAVQVLPLLEALLWPVITALLLAPQRRPPDPDQNRPL
jgi:rod shape-determining protein MreD